MKDVKILYFEGAGMDFYSKEQTNYSDVGNFRIRTAFKNNNGIAYYIELGSCPRYNEKHKKVSDFALRIDHLFKIEDRYKEELSLGGYEINVDHKELRRLDYTKEDITKWINENLNCSFDTIQVLDSFYGYCVHGEDGTFNLIDDMEINHRQAEARRKAYNNIDAEYRHKLNEKYSKISLLNIDDESITIRCHASNEKLKKARLPRIKKIQVTY